MNSVKTEWNSGNFSLTHKAEVTDEQFQILADRGLLWTVQRNREHDVVLGAFEKVNGKSKRKAGFKRNDVEYSDELALDLTSIYGSAEIAEGSQIAISTMITQYEREAATLAFRDAKDVAGRHESAGDLEEWLVEKCEFVGETHGADGEFSREMLAAVHKVVAPALAAAKAAALKEMGI